MPTDGNNTAEPDVAAVGGGAGFLPFCIDAGDPKVRHIIAYGYAGALMILAFGFVAFVTTIGVLCFFYPSHANTFGTMVIMPLLTTFGIYGIKSGVKFKKSLGTRQAQSPSD